MAKNLRQKLTIFQNTSWHYLIENSGDSYIFTESELLGSWSRIAFLSEKHYNRYKLWHILLATALRKKYVESLLDHKTENMVRHAIITALLKNNKNIENLRKSDAFKCLMSDY